MKVLITGATGYIGRRLKHRLLAEKNVHLRLFMKRPQQTQLQDGFEVALGHTFDIESLHRALRGIDVAYYLVHSMNSHDYRERDKQSAHNFLEACIAHKGSNVSFILVAWVIR